MQPEIINKGETSYLTVTQLAKRLQIGESTIYGWVDRDYIPFLMAGDLLRFDPIAIETPAGRADYESRQRTFAVRSEPLRARLLALCRRLLAAWMPKAAASAVHRREQGVGSHCCDG